MLSINPTATTPCVIGWAQAIQVPCTTRWSLCLELGQHQVESSPFDFIGMWDQVLELKNELSK